MNDDNRILVRHERQSDVDWFAVLLETLPISAVVPFLVLMDSPDTWGGFWAVAIPLTASGLGWLKVGRIGTGCLVGIVRAVALWGLATVAVVAAFDAIFCGWEGDESGCDDATPTVLFLLSSGAFLVVAFLVPIGSAIMVARASRIR